MLPRPMRSPNRRRQFLCLVALCTVCATFGCATVTPTVEPAEISFVFHEADTEYYEGLLANFADTYPDISVVLRPVDWNQLGSLDREAGDVLAGDVRQLSYLRDQGDLLDLDPFLEQDTSLAADDFYAGTLGVLTREGRVWGIPAGVDVYVMYLNQDLFDQNGVPYPSLEWTWADFLDRALALRDEDGRGFGYTTAPDHWDAVLFVYQHGGRIVDSEQDPTRIVFDDPLTIEALTWYGQLFHEHDVAPTPMESRAAFGGGAYTYYQAIRGGRVGMWALPLSQRGGLMWPVEWLAEWRVAPPPRDARPASTATIEAYAISSDTVQPDACWRWIRFLSWQMTYRLMPARRSLADSEEYERLVGEDIAVAARASLESAVFFSPDLWSRLGDELDVFNDAVALIVAGKMTADESMDWAQRQSGE